MGRIMMVSMAVVAAAAACSAPEASVPEREIIRVPGSLEGLPFSSAVRVGHTLYLSGQIGTLPGTTELVTGGVAAEARQTLENIRTVLQHAGSTMADVVKCTVFLADMRDYQEVNAVYREFFSSDPPARSAVAGSGLALGAQVEIECIAVVDDPAGQGAP